MSSVYKPAKSLEWVVQQPKSISQAENIVSWRILLYYNIANMWSRERGSHQLGRQIFILEAFVHRKKQNIVNFVHR